MHASTIRWLVVLLLVAAGAAAAVFSVRQPPRPDETRLSWIATARQVGPVGYRDPAGAISPDGKWIAYSEGRFLRVQAIGGGPIVELPPGEAQIRNLSWHPDSPTILRDGVDAPNGWGLYDCVAGTRRRIWRDRDDVRQATWSPDGRSIAGIVNGRDGQEVWAFDTDGKGTRVATPTVRQQGVPAPR